MSVRHLLNNMEKKKYYVKSRADMVSHAYNPSTKETKARVPKFMNNLDYIVKSRPTWTVV